MRTIEILMAFTLLTAVAHAPAALAGTTSIGTNLGVNILFPTDGDDAVVTTAVPGSVGQLFPGFMPGLRIAITDDSGANTFLFDPGLYVLTITNESYIQFQGLLGYQRQFSPASPSSGFINVEVGALHQSYDSESASNFVAGLGLGVRHRMAHGHGAARAEFRVDAIAEDETGFRGGTLASLRIGFDLDTK